MAYFTLPTSGTGITQLTGDGVAGPGAGSQVLTITGLAYSKLNLTGSIVNADINAAAAIAYSKLALTGAVQNADLAGSIAYSKLTLTGSVVNTDVSATAAIAYSKLALTGAILATDLAGSIPDTKLSTIATAGKILDSALPASMATKTFTGVTSFPGSSSVDATGQLGIGRSPTYTLDVFNSTLVGTTAGSNGILLVSSGANGRDASLKFGDNFNSTAHISYLSGALSFRTNGVTAITIGTDSSSTFAGALKAQLGTAAQATFNGWANGTANSSNGTILIGGNPVSEGVIEYEASGAATVTLKNTFDNAGVGFQFKTRTSGTPVNAMVIDGVGNTTTAGYVKASSAIAGLSLLSGTYSNVTTIPNATGSKSFTWGGVNGFGVVMIGDNSSGASATVYYGATTTPTIVNNVGTEFVLGATPAAGKTGIVGVPGSGGITVYNNTAVNNAQYQMVVIGI